MKNKYFVIIFISIVSATLLSLTFSFYYIEKELKRSIDNQLETMASSIFASGLSTDMMSSFDEVDDILSDVLEEERIDRFIRIYRTGTDQLLYANDFAQVVSLPPPRGQKLSIVESGNRHFRVLEISNGPFTLQIALIMDSLLFKAKALEKNILAFTAGILLIIGIITALSLRALLRPLRVLGQDFERWSEQLTFDFPQMKSATGQLLARIENRQESWQGNEIHLFLKQVSKFGQNLSHYLEFSQKQYSVLAHELKTPLTIIRNDLERLKSTLPVSCSESNATAGTDRKSNTSAPADSATVVQKALKEVDELSALIRNFLQWSQQAATATMPSEIYALSLKTSVLAELTKFESLYPGRIKSEFLQDFQVFCGPDHLRQLITNLLQNAFVHGPPDGEVRVVVGQSQLQIWDQGSGLSENILENIGSPFNRGELSRGNGLGLAWCQTICDLYKWRLQFQKTELGHCVSVQFESDTAPHAVILN